MQRSELLIAAIALVIAIFAALGIYHLLAKPQDFIVHECPPVPKYKEIMVAKQDINLGGSLFEAITYEQWPESTLRQTFYQKDSIDEKKLKTLMARRFIAAGEPITESAITEGDTHSVLASLLRPGMRAFSINVDPASASSGLVMPGDIVDVIVTYNTKGTETETKSKTVLCSVHVLALDQRISGTIEPGKKGDALIIPRTATLEVTPEQAEELSSAVKIGSASLSLHSTSATDDNKCIEMPIGDSNNIKIFRGESPAPSQAPAAAGH